MAVPTTVNIMTASRSERRPDGSIIYMGGGADPNTGTAPYKFVGMVGSDYLYTGPAGDYLISGKWDGSEQSLSGNIIKSQFSNSEITAEAMRNPTMTPAPSPAVNEVVSRTLGVTSPPSGPQASSGTPSNTPTGTTPQTGTSSGSTSQGLPPELQGLYDELKNYLDELKRRGQILNQNIEITPQLAAEFLAKAQSEINPYYENLLKTSRETFYSQLGYSKEQVLNNERNLARQYGITLRGLGESAAERGFAQSGLRQRDERELATDTQEAIDTGRRELGFQAGQAARGFAQEYGTANLPALDIGAAPTVSAGEYNFSTSNRQLPLYTLDEGVYGQLKGTKQFEQEAATQARASELESAYRQKATNDMLRQLAL